MTPLGLHFSTEATDRRRAPFTKRERMLPPLNEWGFLPPGVHEADSCEIERRFATTEFRKVRWQRLKGFFDQVTQTDQFLCAYLGGGFVTSKASPSDIDLVLQPKAPYGAIAFQAIERFFAEGLERIHSEYGLHLHFWCTGFPDGASDFRDFFQNIRPTEAASRRAPDGLRKGIVRLLF